MPTQDSAKENLTGAQAALDGYWYQLKVSVFFALDVLAHKQQADQITLEPASQEDLEMELSDEPGALTTGLTIKGRKLVVQCKLRNTGPWTIGELISLLVRGKRRTPPKELLKNSDISYLLVTSADLSGVARDLIVKSVTQPHWVDSIPASLAKELPGDASGRIAVRNNFDQEWVEHRIKGLLTETFRVPQSQIEKCIKKLEEGALVRMRGSFAGVWKRENVIGIIEAHGGYDGTPKDLNEFVPPANWDELLAQLKSRNAIVLTGPSGTGKTTTAKALIASMREENPYLTPVKVQGGPGRLREDQTTGPVIFEIEDPWGKYRVEPESLPWNDEINGFLASSSPDRMFVITSRSDVIKDAKPKSLDPRYKAPLLADHYTTSDRKKLFEYRLAALPRTEQVSAYKYLPTVIEQLSLPLELDRFFGAARLGPKEEENEATFMRRCIDEARNQFIESALVLVIQRQEKWEAAAILWALLKTRKRLTFSVLEELEHSLGSVIPNLEDNLLALVDTLIAGGSLLQNGSEFSCAHPRVEAGLEQAVIAKKIASARVLNRLLNALVDMDDFNQSDWGTETAAHVIAAMSSVSGIKKRVAPATQRHIDNWLTERLASLDSTFRDDLALTSKVGSESCAVAELARWLDESPTNKQWFNMCSWEEPKKPKDWYEQLSNAPHTHAICDAFITRVVPFQSEWFPDNFHEAIAKLSPDLTPSFLASLSAIMARGFDLNTKALINGAILDLDGFDAVFSEAAAYCAKERQSRDRELLLALYNKNYDQEAIEHYWESMGEDGYSASEILRAYIDARRQRGEWHAFAKHPLLEGFLWEWIHVAQKSDESPSEEEMVTFGQITRNTKYEKDFWELADRHFDDVALALLENRLRKGSNLDAVRIGATTVALNHVPEVIEKLFSTESGLSTQRLIELAIDIRSCIDGKEGKMGVRKQRILTFVKAADDKVKDVVEVLLAEDGTKASEESILLLATVRVDASIRLNLAIAHCFWRAGKDFTPRLRRILTISPDVTEENIDLLASVMRLASDCHDSELVKLGLEHDFARVRIEAMNALFGRISGPLPQMLLNMHRDSSSLARKRLVEMLKERPDSSHVPILVKLALDTWTPHHYGRETNVSYPIANEAIEILRAESSLSDEVYRDLVECLKTSKNLDVQLQLLRTMVRHGSPKRQENLVELAIGEGRPTYQRLAARALFHEHNCIPETHLALIDDSRIVTVSPEVCLWLCMLISAVAPDHHLRHLAKTLAANPKRRVFVILLCVCVPEQRSKEVQEEIASFLPEKVVTFLHDLADSGAGDDHSILDELGDVQSVEHIKTKLQLWFKKEEQAQETTQIVV